MEKEKPLDHEALKHKARLISIREGAAFGVFDGCGLRYITPYALLLGLPNALIGPLITLPQMIGNLSQLITLKLLEKGFRRRTLAFTGTLLQTLMWIPLLVLGFTYFQWGVSLDWVAINLILFYSLMIVFGSAVGPAWSSWMGDILPQQVGEYFGWRNRIIGSVTIAAILGAGSLLQICSHAGHSFRGFVMIFLLAFAGRLYSAFLLKRQYEPVFQPQKEYYFTIWQFIRKIPQSNFGKFVVYVSLMWLGVGISAPFFAVYMLKDLHFNYMQFTLVTMTMPFVSMLLMPAWGKFADRYGNLKVVRISGFMIPALPLLWALSGFFRSYPVIAVAYLILVEVLSGFTWAGFNLASSNFIYDAVTRQRVAICVAYYNIFNGIGLFLGGLIGGQIAALTWHYREFSALVLVLLVSTMVRLLAALTMLPLIREVRDVARFGIRDARQKLAMFSALDLLRVITVKSPRPR